MKTVEVYRIGAKVDLGDGLVGRILAVEIRNTGICYEVTWWSGSERRKDWFQEGEIFDERMPKSKIGFKDDPSPSDR